MTTETLERPAQTAIAEYSPTAAALNDLRARLENVAYDLSTGKGMDVAKKDRAEVRGLRVALEAKRVELKAPALERSRLIDAEAKALTSELVALEQPIDAQIKAEEGRKAAEKAAREEEAREAAAFIQGQFDTMRENIAFCVGKPAQTILTVIAAFTGLEITLEVFGDRAGEAQQAKAATLAKLEEMHAAAQAHEAEQARLEDERGRLAAEQKAAAEKLAAERAAFEAEQAKAKAEAQKREDADRARRDEEDRKAREARAAEDKRIADARAELEAQQRAIREAEEAKAAAARKAEQAAADAAAAAERKRLDNEAAAARAEQQRIADEARAEQQRKGEERERLEAANQRVRDAAPMLLAALRDCVAFLVNDQNGNAAPEIRAARAAILEATGEEE